MDITKLSGQYYQSPDVQVIEVYSEGVLCASGDDPTESLGENFGQW